MEAKATVQNVKLLWFCMFECFKKEVNAFFYISKYSACMLVLHLVIVLHFLLCDISSAD